MFVKKALYSFAILRSSKMSSLSILVFVGSFDDLSFIFPISSFIVLNDFLASYLCLDIFSEKYSLLDFLFRLSERFLYDFCANSVS